MTNRNNRIVYLEDKPRAIAQKELLDRFTYNKETEVIQTIDVLGRVSAKPSIAKRSVPHYHASAMDGIAVVTEDTYTAHEKQPLILTPEQFAYVDTGNPIPSPFNAVIMIEFIQELEDGSVEIIEPATPWQYIRPIGEDITEEEMLFTQGHKFRPVDIAALLASGLTEIEVVRRPRVSIIPTGHELIAPTEKAIKGKLIEFNGPTFSSFITEWGGNPEIFPIVTDDRDAIKNTLLAAVKKSDIVVINAGSSAGSKDYTYSVVAELGEVFTHGVACRPGKPVILGKINQTIIVGVPGYPVSAYLALEWFVRPLISAYLGVPEPVRPKLKVKLGRRVNSKMGVEDFVRVNVYYVNDSYIAIPLSRSAGISMSLVRADALFVVPPANVGVETGEEIEVELLKPIYEISNAIAFNGSHDMTLDILAALWKEKMPMPLISTHSGSMAGVLAVNKGEAHVAGIHLLDPVTKQYNLPYVKRIAANEKLVIQPFLKRKQGWIVPKGNPLAIKSIQDIVAKKADYINRQKGAGTRILFDTMLHEATLAEHDIKGYQQEFYTHLSVAAEVKETRTAVGLGAYSAAKIFDLDFIPVADELYDLLMSEDFYHSEIGRKLIELLQSDKLKVEIERLGGYEVVTTESPIFTGND